MKRLAGVMAVLLVFVAISGSAATPPAKAAPLPKAIILQTNLCISLAFGFFNATPIACTNAANMDTNIISFTDVAGQQPEPPRQDKDTGLNIKGDGKATAADFAGIDRDLDQLHEIDGNMLVMVFVDEQFPMQIHVDNGDIIDQVGTDRVHDWVCGFSGGVINGDDPDCIPGAPNGNGVVVFGLKPDKVRGKRGPGKITIIQDRTPLDLTFTVVGEGVDAKFINLETKLEVGADGGNGNPDAKPSALASRLKVTATTDDDCALPGGASGFLDANGTAQRTVTLVRVVDSDGTSISGAYIKWESDAPDIGTTATGLTPTIDLGTFGIGAPNIACGTALPGTFHLSATTLKKQNTDGTGLPFDPEVVTLTRKSTFTVVGAPATIALTATPVSCDGTATTTVSASVIDENGDPVADGQVVDFDVVAFGTANPIHAKVKDGVATSVVSPLASAQTSVTVNVHASANQGKFFDLQTAKNSIRIDCNNPASGGGAAAGAGGAPAGGGAAAGSVAQASGIHGPDTGSGPLESHRVAGGLDLWSLTALGLVGMALAGASMVARKVR